MNIFSDMPTGRRLAAIRNARGMTQVQLADMVGVNSVYISQIERDHRAPGRPLMRLLARTLNTTLGFLECETDEPAPNHEDEPIYFSPEADAAAQLIDAASPDERVRMLAVLRALAEHAGETGAPREKSRPDDLGPYARKFAQRLIDSERIPQRSTQP